MREYRVGLAYLGLAAWTTIDLISMTESSALELPDFTILIVG